MSHHDGEVLQEMRQSMSIKFLRVSHSVGSTMSPSILLKKISLR
jgi:hypothetical protein